AGGQVTVARRDTQEKIAVPRDELVARIPTLLADVHRTIYERALAYRQAHTTTARTREEFVAALKRQDGFVEAAWCGRTECELAIKAETSAVSRVLTGASAAGEVCA